MIVREPVDRGVFKENKSIVESVVKGMVDNYTTTSNNQAGGNFSFLMLQDSAICVKLLHSMPKPSWED